MRRGETFVIVGPSGTGKSVTLQHMVGLLHPDEGEVLIEGENMNTSRGQALAKIRNKFGFLFQSGALINWMNVFENVALPLLEKTDMDYPDVVNAVHEYLALVGLEGIEEKMPAELSGGMRKRVGLARAIIQKPAIVLYDEPTSGLDPVMARNIDRLIQELQKKMRVTSVVVTHDLHSAFTVGNTVAMLYDGQIVEAGSPKEFAASKHPFVKEFMNAQFGELHGGSIRE